MSLDCSKSSKHFARYFEKGKTYRWRKCFFRIIFEIFLRPHLTCFVQDGDPNQNFLMTYFTKNNFMF